MLFPFNPYLENNRLRFPNMSFKEKRKENCPREGAKCCWGGHEGWHAENVEGKWRCLRFAFKSRMKELHTLHSNSQDVEFLFLHNIRWVRQHVASFEKRYFTSLFAKLMLKVWLVRFFAYRDEFLRKFCSFVYKQTVVLFSCVYPPEHFSEWQDNVLPPWNIRGSAVSLWVSDPCNKGMIYGLQN